MTYKLKDRVIADWSREYESGEIIGVEVWRSGVIEYLILYNDGDTATAFNDEIRLADNGTLF